MNINSVMSHSFHGEDLWTFWSHQLLRLWTEPNLFFKFVLDALQKMAASSRSRLRTVRDFA